MKKINLFSTLLLSLTILSCSHTSHQNAEKNSESQRFAAVLNQYTESIKRSDPFWAPYFNVEEDFDKFGNYPSPEYYKNLKQINQTASDQLKTINAEALSAQDQLAYRLFKDDIAIGLAWFDTFNRYLDFNQLNNRLNTYMNDASPALTQFPFKTMKHFEAFLKRSEGFNTYVDNQIALLKEAQKKGIVLNCPTAKAVPNSYKEALESDVEKNPFYKPALALTSQFSKTDQEKIRANFRQMISERIVPGYKKFDHFYRKEYLPHCRHTYGIGALPKGAQTYQYDILAQTNLKLTAQEIHQTGLKEVARIQKEMEKIKNEVGFKGSYKEFLKSLSTDSKYFFTSAEEIFHAFEKAKNETAKKIPQYFSLIPKHDYKIVENSNPEDASGSYYQPTEVTPYGRFVLNTKNIRAVPRYDHTTLLLHEAVPGHHFQLALQFEMKDQLTEYQRKIYASNSFVEGWALYAEYLGNEMGLFNDPIQKLGHLNAEMLRSVRLVVDTGIHAYGWSEKKTIDYMKKYLASDEKDISNEAHRYSVWPGQALGYKIGQLKILELRRFAEKELGPHFDIKKFHETVIGRGTVSLSVLEEGVKEWVLTAKK